MKKVFARQFPEYSVLQESELSNGEIAVLLLRDGEYAVCSIYSGQAGVMAKNYGAGGGGVLSGPLTRGCLREVLQWTDRATAILRYRSLARLPENMALLLTRSRMSA